MAHKPLQGKVAMVTGSGGGSPRNRAAARHDGLASPFIQRREAGAKDTVTTIQARAVRRWPIAPISRAAEVQALFSAIDQGRPVARDTGRRRGDRKVIPVVNPMSEGG